MVKLRVFVSLALFVLVTAPLPSADSDPLKVVCEDPTLWLAGGVPAGFVERLCAIQDVGEPVVVEDNSPDKPTDTKKAAARKSNGLGPPSLAWLQRWISHLGWPVPRR